MSVQENVLQRGSSLTYPSTKPIASKTHMEVQVHNSTTDVWDIVSVDDYDLITNSCVFNVDYDLSPYDMVNVRVGDTPNDLATQPTDLIIVAGIADEIVVVAGIEDDIVVVAGINDEVVATAGMESQIRDVTSEPLRQSILDAESNANRAEVGATEAETSASESVDSAGEALASKQTADSWANASEGADVTLYTWDAVNDVMTEAPIIGARSAYHWQEVAKTVSAGLTYRGVWTMDAACTLPADDTELGAFYIVDAVDPLCLTYNVGDWLIWDETIWTHAPLSAEWDAIHGVTVDGILPASGDDLATTAYVDALLLSMNPIGTVLFRMDAIDPATIYGGTWALITGDASLSFGDGTVQDGLVDTGVNTPVVPVPEHTHIFTGTPMLDHSHTRNPEGALERIFSRDGADVVTDPAAGALSEPLNEDMTGASSAGTPSGTNANAGTAGATLDVRGSRISINVWRRLS